MKDVIIVDAHSNEPVIKKYIVEINNEFDHLIFKPNKGSSQYYIYYLPHVSTGGYDPKVTYKKPSIPGSNTWFQELNLNDDQIDKLPKAIIVSAQSIDDFHSLCPRAID